MAHELTSLTGDRLLAVQTVLVEEYWDDLQRGLAEHGLEVFHVVLDADAAVLRSRIAADDAERKAEQWRLDHIARYESAREWLTTRADLVVNTSDLSADEVASRILDSL